MIVLLDTSTSICKLSVVADGVRSDYQWEAGRTLAKGLLAFMHEKIGPLDQIGALGVMRGPGSFTGLRIGLTVANTLADSLVVPIVGESGDDWQLNALERLRRGDNEMIALPLYSNGAHITAPRK